MLTDLDPCIGPIGLVCDLVSNATSAAQGAASEYVLGGLGAAFIMAAASLGDLALAALDATTTPDLSAQWFRSNLALVATITLPVLVGLFVAQVVGSVLRREPGGLGRALLGVGKATLGGALAVAGTQLALSVVDGLCQSIARASGTTVGAVAARFFSSAVLTSATSPALQVPIGTRLLPSPSGAIRITTHARKRDKLSETSRVAAVVSARVQDLRHTAGSLLIAAGADVKAVQAVLGHASATMTMSLYGHLEPDAP